MTHEEAVRTLATERYLLDEMAEAERDAFEDHYFSCTTCADDVRESSLMQDGVRAGLLDAPRVLSGTWNESRQPRDHVVLPMRTQKSWYRTAVIPWAAAATLAMIAGYQSLVLLPALRRNGGPRALAAVSLRPASRGTEPRVLLGRDLTLALDLSSALTTGELSYDLRTAAGIGVISGRIQAPAPGTPLLLLIPAGVIRTPGHYVLSVADAEYRFEAVR